MMKKCQEKYSISKMHMVNIMLAERCVILCKNHRFVLCDLERRAQCLKYNFGDIKYSYKTMYVTLEIKSKYFSSLRRI